MHVSGFSVDLNWFLQFVVTAFIIAFGVLHLLKNTASKYFVVDANFESSDNQSDRRMPDLNGADECAVCGNLTKKQCSGCKLVRYCSPACQSSHWKSEHKSKCKDFQSVKTNSVQSAFSKHGHKGSPTTALIPACGASNSPQQLKKILFPYEDFVELFNWSKVGFPPCGLINCGNSCFANVVLQGLAYTRPLVAFLLERGHRKECKRNDWCFLCEFQSHVERSRNSRLPFSPVNILSRLPNIGGNLGYGKQEDAHEFMRFAIDAMQSVCLDEFGGEQALHPSSQETTLIQHIFGGRLQSQVVCTKCNNISSQYENMMDLTVEIQGDAASLEECLEQFTVKERLHGDNMYKCDGCNDYVMAWKRLTVQQAPNVLTVALKRFQSGRFGKLNKRVTFPETLDLRPYMNEPGDGNDIYKLFAVVVHVDMLNASFFGHYICYTKDFCGIWYRIDDCKVMNVELEEVLSQGAYMLLYSRVCARPSYLKPIEQPCQEQQPVEITTTANPVTTTSFGSPPSDRSQQAEANGFEIDKSPPAESEDIETVDSGTSSSDAKEIEAHASGNCSSGEETASSVEYEVISEDVSSPEANILNHELPIIDSNIEVRDRFVNTDPKEEAVPETCEMSSVACSSSSDGVVVVNQTETLYSRTELEKVEEPRENFPSSNIITEDDATTGKLAGPKLRPPLFPPGFLGKRSQRKVAKKNEKPAFPLENGKQPSATCDIVMDGPSFPRENGGGLETEEKENDEDAGDVKIPSSSSSSAAISVEEDEIIPINLCNGDTSSSSNSNFADIAKSDQAALEGY